MGEVGKDCPRCGCEERYEDTERLYDKTAHMRRDIEVKKCKRCDKITVKYW